MTGGIPDELSAIPTDRFWMVREDGSALSLEKCSGQWIHSFLAHLASGVDLIPSLEWVHLIGVNLDGMVHLLHSLFYIRVDLYSTS